MSEPPRPPVLSPACADLSDDELARRRDDAPARLEATASAEEASRLYAEQLLPLEREALWRESRGLEPFDLFFITVGAQADTPIQAGLAWPAHRVVFACTESSRSNAVKAANALGLGLDRAEVLSIGDGFDAERIYREIRDTWTRHGRPLRVAIDPTGGYKSMSVAAAAVAFVLPGARTTYVETRQLSVHNRTFWLQTRAVELANPYATFGELERPALRELLRNGNWEAASAAWERLAQRTGEPGDRWRALLARALKERAAMHFEEAAERLRDLLEDMQRDERRDAGLSGDPMFAARARLRELADGLAALPRLCPRTVDPVRNLDIVTHPDWPQLLAFLLSLAEEHRQARRLDLAALLAYRALEGIAARRLGQVGVDVEQERLDCSSSWERLKEAKDPIRDGLDPNRLIGLTRTRNRSIFAHGAHRQDEREVDRLLTLSTERFRRLCELEGRSADALLQAHDAAGLARAVA